MKESYKIITIDKKNIAEHPGVICFINPKHETFPLKIDWIKKRLDEELRIKILYIEGQKKPAGAIEYIPGENAWRAVSAKNYMFIHCIYVYPNKNKKKGIASLLLKECEKDAKVNGCYGMAAVTSSAAFMAESNLFLKNGFKTAEKSGTEELLVKSIKKGPAPKLNDTQKELAKYKGLNLLYSKQCPWVARFVEEIQDAGLDKKANMEITELKTPKQAQKAPSHYAVLNLVHEGRLLADRYISLTRFKNIMKKENIL